MENNYLKLVSKKDFDIDELIKAYLLKHHNDERYISYMLAVYVDAGSDWNKCGWLNIKENKIK